MLARMASWQDSALLCDPSSMLALFTAQVDDCRDILMAAKRVVLAVDTDGPGLALASELVRRCVHTWAVVATYSFLFLLIHPSCLLIRGPWLLQSGAYHDSCMNGRLAVCKACCCSVL